MGCYLSAIFETKSFEVGWIENLFDSFDRLSIFVRHDIDYPFEYIASGHLLFGLFLLNDWCHIFGIFLLFRILYLQDRLGGNKSTNGMRKRKAYN